MTDPTNVFAMDDIKFMTGYNVEPVVASETAVADAILKSYPSRPSRRPPVPGGGPNRRPPSCRAARARSRWRAKAWRSCRRRSRTPATSKSWRSCRRSAPTPSPGRAKRRRSCGSSTSSSRPPSRRARATSTSSPTRSELRVRYRIDGVLRELMSPPQKLPRAISSRIKIMAKLDIAEKRLPAGRPHQIRVADQRRAGNRPPRLHAADDRRRKGRHAYSRQGQPHARHAQLGFGRVAGEVRRRIQRPYGMVLVTGPTGSRQDDHALLALPNLNTPEMNIVTIEDPVEYKLAGQPGAGATTTSA